MSKNQHHGGKSGHDNHHHDHGSDDWGVKLKGTSGDNVLTGTEFNDILFGGAGNDLLAGLGGNDKLKGGKGDDRLFGGDGDDRLDGGKGNDFLDGGAGNDKVVGGKGDDVANFTLSENLGAHDVYDGGAGFDTLQLALTSGELLLDSVQRDFAEFKAFLAVDANLCGDKEPAFHFSSFDLTVRNFEALDFQLVNTAPTARADAASTDEDTLLVIAAPGLLKNDTDPDHLDVLAVTSADGFSKLGAKVLVGADGNLSYDPTDALALQQLAQGATVTDSFNYTIEDLAGSTSTATVQITVTGVDEAPAGKIRVAVVGGTQSIIDAARDQLNDEHSTAFDLNADAILVTAFTTELQWTGAFAGYDVVVIGDDGDAIFDYLGSQIFAALRDFVDTGHGVVTTGAFAKTLFAYDGDADYISPTTPFPGGDFLNVVSGSTVIISDPLHLIAGGITDYLAQGYHEVAGAVDGTATVLAIDSLGRAAIAYDEVGAGRTVYLGSVHMAADSPFRADLTRTADSPVDQIFERAVAWAAGELGGSSPTVSGASATSIESAALPLGGDEPQPDDQFDFNNLQVTESHSSDAENIDLEFALAKVSNDSTETQTDVSEGAAAAAGWDCVDSDAFAVTVATTNVDLF